MSEPIDIWSFHKNFDFDRPLAPDDEMLVDLTEARGSFTRAKLLRQLGVDSESKTFRGDPHRSQYLLFGGHRGCGKSTELRAIAEELHGSEAYFVVFIDAVTKLDVNNLRYSDIALAQAEALIDGLKELKINGGEIYLERLESWFDQRVKKIERSTSLSLEVKTGAEAKAGLPLLGKLFASFTSAIKSNSSYKDEIRREVRDSFSEFAEAFNQLLEFARSEIKKSNAGKSLVFVIDGTDRLSSDDAQAFFLQDIHQLQLIKANYIYCAPIQVLLESGQLHHNYDSVFKLPMVKLAEKGSTERNEIAWTALRKLVEKRLPLEALSSVSVLDKLIGASGGHPRDLLRLFNLCFQETDSAPITDEIADTAIKRLANDYSRLLGKEDYKFLCETDKAEDSDTVVSEQSRRLLYDLCMLEYNEYWWQSHPAVRTLPGYLKVLA